MTIDREDFAEECVRQCLILGVNPHYVLAVAQLRSGISDDNNQGQIGPFRLTQHDWDAHCTDSTFGLDFSPTDITDPRAQISVFAVMARQAFDAFEAANNSNPSAKELYLEQFPSARTATLSTELKAALDATAALVDPAAAAVLHDKQTPPPIIQRIDERLFLDRRRVLDQQSGAYFRQDDYGVGHNKKSKRKKKKKKKATTKYPIADPRAVELLFATNRVPAGERPITDFTGERAEELTFGSARVHIPKDHKIGQLELPKKSSWIRLRFWDEQNDPDRHFILENIGVFDQETFVSVVESDPSHTALVFIHGFNTQFREGVLRFAQIVWDMQFQGVPVHFSWPSRGGVLNYAYDFNSALGARELFGQLIRLLHTEAKVETIHVIAHSMGNFVALEALSMLVKASLMPRVSEIIMAAPDVDVDLFPGLVRNIRSFARGMTLYASANDKALMTSRGIAQKPRAGDVFADGPLVVENMESIDVSAIGGEMFGLNHNVFASNRSLIDDIGRLVVNGARPPNVRSPQIRGVPEGGVRPRYWLYPG